MNEKKLNEIKDAKWSIFESLLIDLNEFDMVDIAQLLVNSDVNAEVASQAKQEVLDDLTRLQRESRVK